MNLKKRLYEDFFRPSKEGEYEELLKAACDNGYEFHTMLSFENVARGGRIEEVFDTKTRYRYGRLQHPTEDVEP